MWILLGAIIVLLLGIVIWAVFGQMETTVSAVAMVEDGMAVCYVREADVASVALKALPERERDTIILHYYKWVEAQRYRVPDGTFLYHDKGRAQLCPRQAEAQPL